MISVQLFSQLVFLQVYVHTYLYEDSLFIHVYKKVGDKQEVEGENIYS